jgi:hypothetical protein
VAFTALARAIPSGTEAILQQSHVPEVAGKKSQIV